MEIRNNYQIQAQQAKLRFLECEQQLLLEKFSFSSDASWIYPDFLGIPYRIDRKTADVQKQENALWVDGNSHDEVMTLLDLICDSRSDRHLSGRWKQTQSFGLMFHRSLLEDTYDPFAQAAQESPAKLVSACRALGGQPMNGGDVSFSLPLFEDLRVWLQFWQGDEEFAPRARWFWDENALMYLKYETMYYAIGLLQHRLLQVMSQI